MSLPPTLSGADASILLEFWKYLEAKKKVNENNISVNSPNLKQRTLDIWLNSTSTSKSPPSTLPVSKVNGAAEQIEEGATSVTEPKENLVSCEEKVCTKESLLNCTQCVTLECNEVGNDHSCAEVPRNHSNLVGNENERSTVLESSSDMLPSACSNTEHPTLLSEVAHDEVIPVESSDRAEKEKETKLICSQQSTSPIKKSIKQSKNGTKRKMPDKPKFVRASRTNKNVDNNEQNESNDVSTRLEDNVSDTHGRKTKRGKRNSPKKSVDEKDQHNSSKSPESVTLPSTSQNSGTQGCKRKGKQSVAIPCKKGKTTKINIQEVPKDSLKNPIAQKKRGRPFKKVTVNQTEDGVLRDLSVVVNRLGKDHDFDFVPVLSMDDKNCTLDFGSNNDCSVATIVTAGDEAILEKDNMQRNGNVLNNREFDILVPCSASDVVSNTTDDKSRNEPVENTGSLTEEELQNNSDISLKESRSSNSKKNSSSKVSDVDEVDIEVLGGSRKRKKATVRVKAITHKRSSSNSPSSEKKSYVPSAKKLRKTSKDGTCMDESLKDNQDGSMDISTSLHSRASCDDHSCNSPYNLRVRVSPSHSNLNQELPTKAPAIDSGRQSDLSKQLQNTKSKDLLAELRSISQKLKDLLSEPKVQELVSTVKKTMPLSGWVFVKPHMSNGRMIGPSVYLLNPTGFQLVHGNSKENCF